MKTRQKHLYRIFLALFLVKMVLFADEIYAQPARGIYLNASDFILNKLSYASVSDKNCKIKIRALSFHKSIKIVCGDSVMHISKDSVYGYRDRENISHRFYNKVVYEVLNPREDILLYRIMISGKTKYEEAVFNYYFSKNAHAAVLPLTLGNIETSFGENKLFIDFIETYFKTDEELVEFDPLHKKYKLNRLLELSKNEN
ncbi:MAG: hypothetical protein ACXVC6_02175 [Bacteroidia bacterium]